MHQDLRPGGNQRPKWLHKRSRSWSNVASRPQVSPPCQADCSGITQTSS